MQISSSVVRSEPTQWFVSRSASLLLPTEDEEFVAGLTETHVGPNYGGVVRAPYLILQCSSKMKFNT